MMAGLLLLVLNVVNNFVIDKEMIPMNKFTNFLNIVFSTVGSYVTIATIAPSRFNLLMSL